MSMRSPGVPPVKWERERALDAVAKLVSAFPAEPLGDPRRLMYKPDDHDAKAVAEIARDKNWLEIADADLAYEAWSLPWTSDEGFLGLLPAFARAALLTEHEDLLANIKSQLDPDTNSDRLTRVMARMTEEQRRALLAVVELWSPSDEPCTRYWRRSVTRPDRPT